MVALKIHRYALKVLEKKTETILNQNDLSIKSTKQNKWKSTINAIITSVTGQGDKYTKTKSLNTD